ncbi:MerR family transcriptional regulator [Amylibacter ulvae]|uniref:MerR family transcriptional regulator n=1 Tax=Paramylibacter ulvae TaxID=1651968 RepID=A0ABQ3CXP2_9RHOB|nr:MerR family DNA-binding transcriptional regulator [Amylibacter ulvae]GHA46145.1 MerR family transcriptional regulator [Amylibacter ulvae]
MAYPILTIREMCERYEVTARALRFYESKGLLNPLRDGSRRLYSNTDRAKLKLILRAKFYGFSLEEISQLLEIYNSDNLEYHKLAAIAELAQKQLSALEKQQTELNRAIESLRHELDTGLRDLKNCAVLKQAA